MAPVRVCGIDIGARVEQTAARRRHGLRARRPSARSGRSRGRAHRRARRRRNSRAATAASPARRREHQRRLTGVIEERRVGARARAADRPSQDRGSRSRGAAARRLGRCGRSDRRPRRAAAPAVARSSTRTSQCSAGVPYAPNAFASAPAASCAQHGCSIAIHRGVGERRVVAIAGRCEAAAARAEPVTDHARLTATRRPCCRRTTRRHAELLAAAQRADSPTACRCRRECGAPPASAPEAPPATIVGNGSWSCWFELLMPLP